MRSYYPDTIQSFREKNIAGCRQDGELHPVLIVSITQNEATVAGINRKTEKMYLKLSALEPLPITEQRLEKLRFARQPQGCFILHECILTAGTDTFSARIHNFWETLRSVHELQNFYRQHCGRPLPLPFIR